MTPANLFAGPFRPDTVGVLLSQEQKGQHSSPKKKARRTFLCDGPLICCFH